MGNNNNTGATFTDKDTGKVYQVSNDPEHAVNVPLHTINIALTHEEKELWDYLELGVRQTGCCGHPNLWHYIIDAARI